MKSELTEKIGIWNLTSERGQECYIRDAAARNEWHHWASISKFVINKGDRYRIAFLGESVARGYFYDPYFTPSLALEKMLNAESGLNAEVIDLARTNFDLNEVTGLSSDCMSLSPDALVIFGGNNWIMSVRQSITEADLKDMFQLLKEEGIGSLKKWFSTRSHQMIDSFLKHLHNINATYNIPVILIIPQFNLLHWQSCEHEQIVAHLTDNSIKEWLEAKEKAAAAFQAGDMKSAETFSRQMIDLDISNPLGYEWVAKCCIETGRMTEAESFLNGALDTAIYYKVISKPRFYTFMRESVVSLAPSYNINVVDMAEVIHNENKLPGADLFLDYCHLTYEGIQLAMEATANTLLSVEKKARTKQVSKEIVKNIKPTDEVIAYANFCAAIHNAHFAQPYERLFGICKDALNASLQIKDLMLNYIDFVTRCLPNYFCKSFKKITDNEFIRQYDGGTGFFSKRNAKIMDVRLVNAIVDALKCFDCDVEGHIRELRKAEHGSHLRKINLLKSYYAADSHYVLCPLNRKYYQAFNIHSRFTLVAEGTRPVSLKLTYRNPKVANKAESLTVQFNNQTIAVLPSAKKWKTVYLSVGGHMVQDGVNFISIQWPNIMSSYGNTTIDSLTEVSENSLFEHIFPALGEIYMFNASQLDNQTKNKEVRKTRKVKEVI